MLEVSRRRTDTCAHQRLAISEPALTDANTAPQSPLVFRGLASRVDEWLTELGVEPVERAEREGAASWDIILDGRRRRGLRVTLILDPALALVAWVHFAPPTSDNFRKTYRQLLRWNDELPFAKFAITEDERPVLSAEVPADALDRDVVGRLLARMLAICDLVHEPALAVMGELRRRHAALAESPEPDPAGVAILDRYAADLGELAG